METTRIRIDTNTIIRTILILGLAYLLYELSNILLVIVAAVVIASAFKPLVDYFENNGIPRIPTVVGLYLLTASSLFVIAYFFVPPILQDLSDIVAQAPEYIRSLQLEGSFIGQQLGGASGQPLSVSQLVSNLRETALGNGQQVFSFVSSFFGGVVSFFLILTLSFYLSIRRGGVEQFLRLVVPTAREDYVVNLWQRSQKKFGQWMQGQLVLMFIVGLLVYLGLAIIGVPNALLLAVIAGLLEAVPVFGPLLSAIPAIGLAGLSGGISLALITAGLFIIVQQFENNLIHPLVVNQVVGVPPIIVILAVVIGAALAGLLGAIMAVPIAAALMEFARDVELVKHGGSTAEIADEKEGN